MKKRLGELHSVVQELAASRGSQPTSHEIAAKMQIPVAKVDELRTMGKEPAPLDAPGTDGGSKGLLKTVPDDSAPNPLSSMLSRERREKVLAAMELLAPVSRLPWVDPALIREVERRLAGLSEFDPFDSDEARVVVHGDAQPSNLIVDDGSIVALL